MPNLNVKDAGGATVAIGCLPTSTSRVSYAGNITTATTTQAIAAQGAGQFTYVTDIDLFNAGQTSVLVQLTNSAAAVLWEAWVPAGGGVSKALATPVGGNGQMTANTALSLVTGAGTTSLYANLNGFVSTS